MIYLKPLAKNFHYYPRTMIRLCVIAYEKPERIAFKMNKLDWQLVWGPVEHIDSAGTSRHLIYIAKRDVSDEYAVVIRGISPYHMASWFTDNRTIANTYSFNRLAPHAPNDAHISQNCLDILTDLLEATDGAGGRNIVEFLRNISPSSYIYVTGHGIGGMLVPPMFATLNDHLYGGGYVANMAPFTFGSHTPGDINFSIYFNSLFDQHFAWRMYNDLDIAPLCWHSLPEIRDIYKPHGLEWHPYEGAVIEAFFDASSDKEYVHPSGSQLLQGSFDTHDEKTWFEQAIHQHHPSTYQLLVDAAFPEQ